MTRNFRYLEGLAIAPGLLLFLAILSGCSDGVETPASDDLCFSEVTPITAIQGDGYYSPLEDSYQLVSGWVTLIEPGGYYIEQSGGDRQERSSRALFVEKHREARNLQIGQLVVAGGKVEETGERRDKMTSLVAIDRFARCESSLPLPLSHARLPLSNPEREALEGMRVIFEQDFVVSDVYSLYRGIATLSAGSALRIPTEDLRPGRKSGNLEQENRERSINVRIGSQGDSPVPAGTLYDGLIGVLGHDGRNQLLLAESALKSSAVTPEALEPPEPGTLRVVNANLLNYFNGNGRGGGFPTERGAESLGEFRAQQKRLGSAMERIRPDLLAVQELENDGFGPRSAARSLAELLDGTGNGSYGIVERPEGRVGNDVISVGLFYRELALTPVGPSHTLDSEPFRDLNRQPLAQLFRETGTGEEFLAVVNHLKSKGSCPDSGPNKRQDDGQGCWNPARVEAVDALLHWVKRIANEAGTDRVLILGDMNAYRREDPIHAFRNGGYTELVESMSGQPTYSYRHFGRAGTLDYAFASPSMAALARQARIWHINADWPRRMELPEPWLRMSDHDPVIVDFAFP